MKKIFLMGAFLLLASNIFAQERLVNNIPFDWNSRGVAVTYVQVGDSLFPASVNANNELVISLGTGVYDSTNQAARFVLLNGRVFHYTAPIDSALVANLDTDSTQFIFNVQSYLGWSLQISASGGVTYKVWVTNKTDASQTNPYDGNWVDYSTTILGAATKVDVDGFYIQDTPLPAYQVMLRAVTSDATNALNLTLIKSGL